MGRIGFYVMPCAVIIILISAFLRKVKVFDEFLIGAEEGLRSCVKILPSIIGLLTAVYMLQSSGAIDMLSLLIKPLTSVLNIPSEILPLAVLRPFSGSGSLALLNNIFKYNSPDGFIGRLASVMMGSSETTFYAISVYFGAVRVTRIRHTVFCAVLGDIFMAAAAIIVVGLLFGEVY